MTDEQRVLIIDPDPRARFLIKGVLTRDLNVPVVEVDSALGGLEALEKERFLFVLLELSLPTIGGVRVLEIIRQSPHLAGTPVIALTALGDEATIRQIIQLGIVGVIAKPLERAKLGERLLSYMGRIGRTPHVRTGAQTPMSATSTVLVADGDPNFRHFVTSTLRGERRILSASTGVDALRLALTENPAVALIGQDLGVLRSEVLVMEMRAQAKLQTMRIVSVMPRGQTTPELSSVHYDGVMSRTFIPEIFREQFDRQFSPVGPIDRLLGEHPALHAGMVSAVEQICGMMLNADVTELATHPGFSGDIVEASQLVTMPDGLTFLATVTGEIGSATIVGARLLGTAEAEVTGEDAGAALGEVVNIVTGRLRNALGEGGVAIRCDLPVIRAGSLAGTAHTQAEGRRDLFFGSSDGTIMLAVTLSPAPANGP
jgi:CheY-like chemotaxis protein